MSIKKSNINIMEIKEIKNLLMSTYGYDHKSENIFGHIEKLYRVIQCLLDHIEDREETFLKLINVVKDIDSRLELIEDEYIIERLESIEDIIYPDDESESND